MTDPFDKVSIQLTKQPDGRYRVDLVITRGKVTELENETVDRNLARAIDQDIPLLAKKIRMRLNKGEYKFKDHPEQKYRV
jgi:ribosome-associated translation inhibitor RaiA